MAGRVWRWPGGEVLQAVGICHAIPDAQSPTSLAAVLVGFVVLKVVLSVHVSTPVFLRTALREADFALRCLPGFDERVRVPVPVVSTD